MAVIGRYEVPITKKGDENGLHYRMYRHNSYRIFCGVGHTGRPEGPIIMFGNATIEIPASGHIGPSQTDGLSDELAIAIGRLAARTLSEPDTFVTVTLENGTVTIIGHNDVDNTVVIGWVKSPSSLSMVNMDVIRRCGGFREYANDVIGGPIL